MTEGLILDVDLNGIEKTTANISAFPSDLGRELTLAMNLSLQFTEGQVAARTPVNLGAARSSITHQIISPFPALVGSVGSPLPYVPVLEFGRKPGGRLPPVEAIKFWVIRKLQVPRDEAESVAWAIAKHIAKHGTEGKFMFKEGLEVSEPHIRQLFDGAIARATARANS